MFEAVNVYNCSLSGNRRLAKLVPTPTTDASVQANEHRLSDAVIGGRTRYQVTLLLQTCSFRRRLIGFSPYVIENILLLLNLFKIRTGPLRGSVSAQGDVLPSKTKLNVIYRALKHPVPFQLMTIPRCCCQCLACVYMPVCFYTVVCSILDQKRLEKETSYLCSKLQNV